MNPIKISKPTLALLIATFIGCYFTVVPALCMTAIVLFWFMADRAFLWRDMKVNSDLAKEVQKIAEEGQKLKSQMDAIQIRLGMGVRVQ